MNCRLCDIPLSGTSDRCQNYPYCVPCRRYDFPTPPPAATKFDTSKPRFSLAPPHALTALIAVMEHGAAKYGEHNWKQGMNYTRCFDAAIRHLRAWQAGQDIDPESGLQHLAHAMANCAFIIDWTEMKAGKDDRDAKVQ